MTIERLANAGLLQNGQSSHSTSDAVPVKYGRTWTKMTIACVSFAAALTVAAVALAIFSVPAAIVAGSAAILFLAVALIASRNSRVEASQKESKIKVQEPEEKLVNSDIIFHKKDDLHSAYEEFNKLKVDYFSFQTTSYGNTIYGAVYLNEVNEAAHMQKQTKDEMIHTILEYIVPIIKSKN